MKNALILDDHKLFAHSFATLLERGLKFDVVKTFSDEDTFMNFYLQNEKRGQLIFLDFYLKTGFSLHLLNEIRRVDKRAKVIITSSVINPKLIQSILDCEPDGFISKCCGIKELLDCLNNVWDDRVYISPDICHILSLNSLETKVSFSPKELNLLAYFKKGYSIEETAKLFSLSKHTIVSHRRKMMAKANAKSITELIHFAEKYGYLE